MEEFNRLLEIVAKLRAPNGCPWDREQTPETMRKCVIEESFELLNSIDNNDINNIQEELGDLFLNISMISTMYKEKNIFDIKDVLKNINEKLIRRHPHVFGDTIAKTGEEALMSWNSAKEREKQNEKSLLDSIPKNFPPMLKATKLQQKVAKVGFDWNSQKDVINKIEEEFVELKKATEDKNLSEMEEELGDLLFSVINLARFLKIDPTVALNRTNEKFIKRFKYIEKNCDLSKKPKLQELDKLWDEAKKLEKKL